MNMKKSVFWKLGIITTLAFGLNACSSSSAPDDDEDDNGTSTSLSSGKAVSSSSKASVVCKNVTETLATPTNLQVVKNGDNKWVLIWDYSANDNRIEDSFIIEVLDMTAKNPKWQVLDSTNADVVMYNLSGESMAGKYYRVSAKDECGVSKATDMVEVTSSGTASTSSATLAAPSGLKLDTLGDNMWQLSWSYTNNPDRPENGFKLQSLDLNAKSPKWTDDGTTNKGVHVIKIDGNKKGGLLFHVAAKDTNGVSEYSEEITIPRIADSTSSTSTSSNMDLAVPTNLKLDSVGVNKYQLSWSYTDNTARPENGFRLQSLDLSAKSPKWAVMDSTNKGVCIFIVDATKNGGKYVRVAAKDSKGTSTYSEQILIPTADTTKVAGQEIDLAVPANLTLTSQGNNEYLLSWSYTDVEKRPAKGFVMQKLVLSNGKSWEDLKVTINKDVLFYQLTADTVDYFIRIAAKDDKGLSAYSNVVQVLKKGSEADISNPPTNLTISRIAPSVWELSWIYENNVENADRKFIIQSSKLNEYKPENFKWKDVGIEIDGNLRTYYIIGMKNIETFYRMAVVNDGDTSAFTETIQLTPEIAYRDYMALNVPVPSMKFSMYYVNGIEVDRDTSTQTDKAYVTSEATYTITSNFISKYIRESEYTDTVYYEARWFTSLEHYNLYKKSCEGKKKSDVCDSCYWIEKFPYEEPSISKRFDAQTDYADAARTTTIYKACKASSGFDPTDHKKLYNAATDHDLWLDIMDNDIDMSNCLLAYIDNLCSYYVQLRIVWKDTNGETDYSEWTQPYNVSDISGADDICKH